MTGAEMKIPTPEELEAMMGRGELKLLGAGSRRECYAIPGTQLCLKCYRDESTAPNASVAREIRKYRHDEKRNTCAQEYRYWLELKSKLPAYIFAAFPESLELIHLPTRGYALLETRVENEDGSACTRFSSTYRDALMVRKGELLDKFKDLVRAFAAYRVRFYDTQNIIVQEQDGLRLRVVDFEPEGRVLIPIDRLLPRLVEAKVLRRAKRYAISHLGVRLEVNSLPSKVRQKWDQVVIDKGRVRGITDAKPFLENKFLNDIFYRGKFKDLNCVVKCSSRAIDTLQNEAEILRRLHATSPVHFPSVLDYWQEGGYSCLAMEDVGRESLSDQICSGDYTIIPPDSIASDILALHEALIQTGIVHRDLYSGNLMISPKGHVMAIDFQLGIDRNDYRETSWARRHPRYLYVVFGANRDLPLGAWNDCRVLCDILDLLPQTAGVVRCHEALARRQKEAEFSAPPRGFTKIFLLVYQYALRLQWLFASHKRRPVIAWRISRFSQKMD